MHRVRDLRAVESLHLFLACVTAIADTVCMTDPAVTQSRDSLEGIGGWLLIPFFGLLLSAFDHANAVFDHELPKAAIEILVGHIVMAIGSLVVFTVMCRRLAIVPMLVIVYAVTDIAFHSLAYVATVTDLLGIDPEIATGEQPRVLESLRMTVAFWFVFVPYFLVSKRVKATFDDDPDLGD